MVRAQHSLLSQTSYFKMIELALFIMIVAELYVTIRIFLKVTKLSDKRGPFARTSRVPVTMRGYKIRSRPKLSDCYLWNTLFPDFNNFLHRERKRLGLHTTFDDLCEAQKRKCIHVHDERCLAQGCDRDKQLPQLYRGLYAISTPNGSPQLYYFENQK